MKREINMRSDRNQANQLIENSLKEYKKSIGEVILVSVGPRTTIEMCIRDRVNSAFRVKPST